MNDFIFQQLIPKLESLNARLNKVEAAQKQFPTLKINIESSNCDELISQIQKIYNAFSGGCNLEISVSLKVVE